ncbi:hypothetical protein [Pedosphaera parvula]|uniref:hypothetical protein n=1 Tax=Pedosphaera parvula TaxID=1032527 RepID=UPI0002E9275B|nr:hypothetical protein [Pedosphaera parvula]
MKRPVPFLELAIQEINPTQANLWVQYGELEVPWQRWESKDKKGQYPFDAGLPDGASWLAV